MGRKRKDGDPLGLAGTRLAFKRGRFFYIHRGTPARWEDVGTDVEAAKRQADRYNNPGDGFGTLAYWFRQHLADCKVRVKAGTLSQRTLDDYEGYAADDGPLVAAFGKRFPERVTPHMVQQYLDTNANMDPPRPVPANRERAYLSSCISWLIREDKVPGLVVNPCMRASGVQRNTERPRERYVGHDEYRAVYEAGGRALRLAMELVYRTLQRPEVDVLAWTPANVRVKDGQKVLRFQQSKTKRWVDIALVGELGALVAEAIGEVPVLHQPILHTTRGTAKRKAGLAYTYDGISALLKKAQERVRLAHGKPPPKGSKLKQQPVGPLRDMPSFGLRDLKGKGATDMWLDGVPIEQIQLLCGHADKATTEKYIKARWRVTAQPNNREIA